jgi:hypothetical protein
MSRKSMGCGINVFGRNNNFRDLRSIDLKLLIFGAFLSRLLVVNSKKR